MTRKCNTFFIYRSNWWFLCKEQWTYGPRYCLSIDTHIRSKSYKVVYFWVFFPPICQKKRVFLSKKCIKHYAICLKKMLFSRYEPASKFHFLSPPVHMHGGLVCIAFCLSVCLSVCTELTRKKIHISKSIIARSLKLHHNLWTENAKKGPWYWQVGSHQHQVVSFFQGHRSTSSSQKFYLLSPIIPTASEYYAINLRIADNLTL